MAKEKFHFKQGDVLQLEDVKIGNGAYGDWQYIKVLAPDHKTNSQIFLSEIVENLHPGDWVRVDQIEVYPRRAKVENTKGELAWTTIFKIDIKVSLAESPGFTTQYSFTDEGTATEGELPF